MLTRKNKKQKTLKALNQKKDKAIPRENMMNKTCFLFIVPTPKPELYLNLF